MTRIVGTRAPASVFLAVVLGGLAACSAASNRSATTSVDRPPTSEATTDATAAPSSTVASTSVALGSPTTTEATAPVRADGAPASRQWLEAVEAVVRDVHPTPPEAARIYAYAATAYADAVEVFASAPEAGRAVLEVLDAASPAVAGALRPAAATAGLPVASGVPSKLVQVVIDDLVARVRTDGFTRAAAPTEPAGDGLWRAPAGKAPLSPNAGGWARWLVGGSTFTVDEPPAPGSAAQQRQLAAVRRAVAQRDARWVSRIGFWGGAPGTNTPSGIWQDVAWTEAQRLGESTADRRWAATQATLAKTLADAFVETWQVKYRYWTARPDMVDPTITTAMPDPMFPSYVSGHSTVSAAAATVLTALMPVGQNVWTADAEEARDTRLVAGIHFPADNDEGFALGRAVGAAAVQAAARANEMSTSSQNGPAAPRPERLHVSAEVVGDAAHGAVVAGERDGVLAMATLAHSPGTHDGTGVLVRLSKPGYDRTIVLATTAGAVTPGRLNTGWTATVLSRDPMWSPAACGGVPTALVGGRWVTYAESTSDDAGRYQTRLVAFDLQGKRFASYLPEPNDVAYTGTLAATGDHTVVLGFDADRLTGVPQRARYIDLTDGSYVDRAYVDTSETWPAIDGVRPAPAADEHDDLAFTDDAGTVRARIHLYRAPGALGWTARFGYLGANDGASADAPGGRNVGVYDVAATTWDWALVSDSSPDAPSVLPLGTAAA